MFILTIQLQYRCHKHIIGFINRNLILNYYRGLEVTE